MPGPTPLALRRLACSLLLSLSLPLAAAGQAPGGAADPNSPHQPPDVVLQAALEAAVRPVPVGATASALPEGWHHGAFAEIFVRSYRDSDGDGIGDLRGLTQSLDYLQDLGVRGLWLMPVSPSQDRDHGYAVSDYRAIEPAYGTLADFDELLRQAHARGIGVVIDYVINHSAATNPLFLESARAADSRFRNWYVWKAAAPAGWRIFGRNPWEATASGAYLAQFSTTMPDFNLLEPAVVAFHKDNLRFWLNRGVDGFRFDAVSHLVEHGPDAWYDQVEDYGLMAQFREVVDGYQHRYVVCEATGKAARYASPDACGGAFAIELAGKIVAAAGGSRPAIDAVSKYFLSAPAGMATLVSNHDLFAGERLWDQVGGDAARYRLAAATYLLQPGTPFIYYGEEIGMSAAPGLEGDRKLRVPMSWSADPLAAGFSRVVPFRPIAGNAATQNVARESARADGLLAWYRALVALRNAHPALARGSYEAPSVQGRALAFRRRSGDEIAWVVINYDRKSKRVSLPGSGATAWRPVFAGGATAPAVAAKGKLRLELPAQSVQVWIATARAAH